MTSGSKLALGSKPIIQRLAVRLSSLYIQLVRSSLNFLTEVRFRLNGWIAQWTSIVCHDFPPLGSMVPIKRFSLAGALTRIEQNPYQTGESPLVFNTLHCMLTSDGLRTSITSGRTHPAFGPERNIRCHHPHVPIHYSSAVR